jgi:hypothetical protein
MSSKNQQSQLYQYAHEALHTLFFHQTKDFLFYIDRDGNDFLKFWWEHIAANFPEEERRSPAGLDHEIYKLDDGRTVFLIELPTPRAEPEPYYMAMVSLPVKRSLLSWQNLPRIFALEYKLDKNGTPGTVIAEWTYRGNHIVVAKGTNISPTSFYKAVVKILTEKKQGAFRLPWQKKTIS